MDATPTSARRSASSRRACRRVAPLLDLGSGEIRSVVWATGFRPDYSWLDVPVVDHKGHLRHDGGVVESPGLYAIGLPVLRRRKSTFIHGAEDDARDIVEHLAGYLSGPAERTSAASEPRERSAPTKRRARERVGGFRGAKPPGRIKR